MTTAAVKIRRTSAEHALGSVLLCDGRRARVALESGELWADVAVSCLVAPAPGDRVLVVHEGDEAWVLAVLRKDEAIETRISFESDVSIEVARGRLRLSASEGVEVATPRALRVAADAVHVAFSALDLVGQSVSSKTKKVRVVAEAIDTVAGRIYERAINFLRRTDELDRVEAKNIDRRAEHMMHVHGENVVTTAEELVKITASQVHVG